MAVLAAVKLGVLASMGFVAPKEAAPQPAQPAVPAPRDHAAAAARVVRAAILDAPVLAQPAPQPAAKTPPQPEAVLSVAALKQRAEALDRQEQTLKALEAELNTRLAKLQSLENTLKGMLDQANSLKEEKMRHLIDVYTNMKSKQAASVLETLDEGVAVKILSGMKGRQAGEILSNVSAKKAAKLSEELTKLQVIPDLPAKP